MQFRRITVIIMLLLVALILGACGGGDEEDGAADTPTVPSFPSSTPMLGGTVAVTPSLTPLPLGPTPTRFAGFPTLSAPPTVPSTYPNSMQIVSPVSGQELAGNVTFFGSASHPNFVQYTLEYGPDPNPSNLWYPITPQAVTVPVLNNALGAWNTTLVPDGNYQVRLHVYLNGLPEVTNVAITGLRVQNTAPPPPPPTNTAPTISPIAPLNLQVGRTATIALGIYDADGDSTTFIPTSDNTTVATVTPSGQAITIFAREAGVATIRIQVIDARGATAETSFLVTVVQPELPNNPPNIDPIPSQTLTQGATINIAVNISDPDGDTISDLVVQSASPAIAGVSKSADNQSINIAGFAAGTTTVTLTAQDSRGASSSIAFAVVVNPPAPTNDPPSIGTIPGQSLEEGTSTDIALSISDPNGDATSYTLASSEPAAVGVSDLGGNTIRITGNQPGAATVTVTVDDGRGGIASTAFSVTVNARPDPNQNPTISPIADQTLEVGEILSVDLLMSDPDGDSLTFSTTSDDVNIATTGQVDADTLSITGVAEGVTSITVAVGDGNGGSTTTTFNVTVTPAVVPNNPPILDAISPQALEVGQTVLVTINYSDPDGDPLSILATSDNTGVATVFQSDTFELTVAGAAQGGATITVTVDDSKGGTASRSFGVTVNAANQNPIVDPIAAQACVAGEQLNLTANYYDPDGDPVTATVASDNDGIASTALNGAALTVNCVSEGVAAITITAEDNRGGLAATAFTVTVGSANQSPILDPIAPQTCNEGDVVPVTLNYSDPDGDTVNISPVSDNQALATVGMADAVTLNVNCASQGTANITVTADDGKGGTAVQVFSVTINVALPINQPPTIDQIDPQACQVGDFLPVALNYNDPDGDLLNVTAISDNNGIATATVNGDQLDVSCNSAGTAFITVAVDDGKGGTASTTFGVTVNAANQQPFIDQIDPQVCNIGDVLSLTINYSDPDGDLLSVNATADNGAVADASVAGFTLTVSCNSAGTAFITVAVDDGKGGTASTTFGVTVNATNQQPTIDQINPQVCNIGDVLSLTINYSDPDGDPLSVNATADNGAVADASVAGFTLTVSCNSAGTAFITVAVDDGKGGTASTTFGVTVNAANQQPFIDQIDPQVCNIGDVLSLTINYSDPDGDPLSVNATADNGAVADASVAGFTLTVSCNSAGTAFITVAVDDGKGGTASTTFGVTVNAANQQPFIDQIAPQGVEVGQSLLVAINYSDPDGDALTVTPTSDNPGVAGVVQSNMFELTVSGVAEGTTNITVTVDDGKGGINSTSFSVTVTAAAPPPPFDVTPYPEIPDMAALLPDLGPVYSDGINNFGRQPNAFSIVGDDSLSGSSFLESMAAGTYNLGNYGSLQGTIDAFNFGFKTVANNPGWNTGTLLDPAAADGGVCNPGETPLACELRVTAPVVVFVSFSPSNAVAIPVDTFRVHLETIVDTALNTGTIPVLVTLPDDGTVDATTLGQYNQVIVEVATQHSAHPDLDVPLWNLYNTMTGASNGVNSVSPSGPVDFTDASLTYGVNRRGLAALRILDTFRLTFQ